MRLFLQYFKLYWKSWLFTVSFLCITAFSFYQLLNMYVQWPELTVNPLETTLKLSKYIFVFYLVISYMFYRKSKQVSLDECLLATPCGKRRLHYFMQLAVMLVLVLLLALLFFIYNAVIFEVISRKYDRTGIGSDYLYHIFQCIFTYIFLVGALACMIGAALQMIGNRITGYALILLIIFISGPYVEKIVNTLMDTMGINLFRLRGFFDIFPINLDFSPNIAFGFSVLPYKIAVITFWIGASCLGIVFAFKLKRKAVVSLVALCVCAVSMNIYLSPASKVIMDNSPQGSAMQIV